MTIKEYNQLKEGDKIQIKVFPDNNRIITLGDISKSPWFKYETGGKQKGFMVGNIFYGYKQAKVVKRNE